MRRLVLAVIPVRWGRVGTLGSVPGPLGAGRGSAGGAGGWHRGLVRARLILRFSPAGGVRVGGWRMVGCFDSPVMGAGWWDAQFLSGVDQVGVVDLGVVGFEDAGPVLAVAVGRLRECPQGVPCFDGHGMRSVRWPGDCGDTEGPAGLEWVGGSEPLPVGHDAAPVEVSDLAPPFPAAEVEFREGPQGVALGHLDGSCGGRGSWRGRGCRGDPRRCLWGLLSNGRCGRMKIRRWQRLGAGDPEGARGGDGGGADADGDDGLDKGARQRLLSAKCPGDSAHPLCGMAGDDP